jgi:prepilin-type N-terminal cleavage/methylation domain-containing protein
MKKKGFTLIELLIVVIVIAILATLALPQYVKAVERAKDGKSKHHMALIAEAEKMYRAEHDTYISFSDGGANDALGNYVELNEIDADEDWTYGAAVSTSTFLITSTRSGGPNDTETNTLTQNGVWAGTFTP